MTSVGYRELAVLDSVQEATIPMWLLYPTAEDPRRERFGAYSMQVAKDAAPAGDAMPLVVISHGTGGTPWAYRGLATHLVHEGFAVAMIAHPGNTRDDNALADEDVNLTNRPRHVRLAIDAAFAGELGERLREVTVIGHSLGGYTALAAAGGRAMTLPKEVVGMRRANPDAETARLAYPVQTERDARIRAVVLLAPALGWLMARGALADVTIPIMVRTGERDDLCPASQVLFVLRTVPDRARVHHVDVPNAGHFAFMSPFPAELVTPGFLPAYDPPGFDRGAYQDTLHAEVAAFLRATI